MSHTINITVTEISSTDWSRMIYLRILSCKCVDVNLWLPSNARHCFEAAAAKLVPSSPAHLLNCWDVTKHLYCHFVLGKGSKIKETQLWWFTKQEGRVNRMRNKFDNICISIASKHQMHGKYISVILLPILIICGTKMRQT